MPEKRVRLTQEMMDELERLGKPVAMDRHFKLPIHLGKLSPYRLGEFGRYNPATTRGQDLADIMDTPEYIAINPKMVPQSYKWNEENRWNPTIKHELVHALQARAADKGKDLDVDFFKGQSPANNFLGFDPFVDLYKANTYHGELARKVGLDEAEAYALSDTVGVNKDLPRDPESEEAYRQRLLQKLQEIGLGKYGKIWRGR